MVLWYERLGCVALEEDELELQCYGGGLLELALRVVDEQKEALKSQEQQAGLVLQYCVLSEVMLNDEPQRLLEGRVLQDGVVPE